MTACTNHGGKARRVVTAALVGVLSVGTVPMVALAEGVGDGIQTLALSAQDAFKNGEMTEARDSKGRRLDIPADGIVTVEAGNYVVPTQVTPKDGDPVDIYILGYNTDDARQANAKAEIDGSALASVDAATLSEGKHTVEVTVKLDGTTNVSDTTFTSNGQPQKIGVAVGGKAVTSGYSMTIDKRLDASGKADAHNNVTSVVDAGTYLAIITDTSTGVVVAKINFKVNQVNLSTASVSVSDVDTVHLTTDTVKTVYVDGVAFSADGTGKLLDTLAEVTTGQLGTSSVVVTPNASAGNNIIGSATVELNVVNKVLDINDVNYNGFALPTGNTIEVNLADGGSFYPERIEVFDNTVSPAKKLDASYYTVTYKDANGNVVDASALANPGKYTVIIDVNSEACRYAYGDDGNMSFKVNVNSATVEGSDIVFKFDGKVGNDFEATYDGTDMLERLETVVHTKWGDDLVEGTDYTVQAYKGDEKVDSIVDADDYTVKVELKGNHPGLNANDLKCDITVKELDLKSVFVNGGDLTQYTYNETGTDFWGRPTTTTTTVWYLGYTGEDLEPSFELGYYTDKDGNVVDDVRSWTGTITAEEIVGSNPSAYTWHALPADALEITGYTLDGKAVDALNAKGEYTTSNVITVSDAKVGFVDVSADAWYAQGVFDAKQLGYVKGVSGTDMYAPEAQISRADALIIISRMAGFDQTVNAEDYLAENGGYVTRYTDVDMGAYYAKAVAWGTKMGIVNGYGDGTFGPNDPITREQFAGMLANYAKATGDYATPSADALDGIADASGVDAWANEAVSWAVENGVMGNGGYVYAQNEISRAEVACMAVNYQPEGASTSVIG